MTLPFTVALLATWSIAMYRYGRSVLFPPASLGIVWTITMFAIWLCGDLYFPLTTRANEIVLAGVLAFSLGGICAVVVPLRRGRTLTGVSAKRRTQIDRWLTIAGIVLLLNIPFSYLYFRQLSETIAPRESLWRQIRIASSKANVSGHNPLSLESFILPFLSIVALIAVYEYAATGRRRRPHSLPRPARRWISTTEWRPLRSAALADQLSGNSLAEAGRRPRPVAGNHGPGLSAGLFAGPDVHEQIWRGLREHRWRRIFPTSPRVSAPTGWAASLPLTRTGKTPSCVTAGIWGSSPSGSPTDSAQLIPNATAISNTQKSPPPRSPTSIPRSCLTTWIMVECPESSG